MRFHLDYNPPAFGFEITHEHRIMLAGSCFSENIGALLRENRFNALVNPGGILFNPASLMNFLSDTLDQTEPRTAALIRRDDTYLSFMHHSSVHAASEASLIEKIRHVNNETSEFLKTADVLIITFGTAFAYFHHELRTFVANCHRQPGTLFSRQLLTVEEITKGFGTLLKKLQAVNPSLKIIFTVSPVKYLREGLPANNLSKGTLLLAVHQLVQNHENCSYFPAYELVTDDLRDYRFYREDLAHPTEEAIRYVWDKFATAAFSEKTQRIIHHISNINRALAHRPITRAGDDPALSAYIEREKELLASLAPEIQF